MADKACEKDTQTVYVLMGVSGCGKSAVGEALETELCQRKLTAVFLDADDYHPKENIDKMSKGQPLTDEDRWPWLQAVVSAISESNGIVIVGCSALKKKYREFLVTIAQRPILFVHLSGSIELILKRMAERKGHFMSTEMLQSQFSDLEKPDATENAIAIDINESIDDIVSQIQLYMTQGQAGSNASWKPDLKAP